MSRVKIAIKAVARQRCAGRWRGSMMTWQSMPWVIDDVAVRSSMWHHHGARVNIGTVGEGRVVWVARRGGVGVLKRHCCLEAGHQPYTGVVLCGGCVVGWHMS